MKPISSATLAVTTCILLAPLALSQSAIASAPESTFTAVTAKNFDATLDVQLIAAVKAKDARKVGDLLARNANPNAHENDATGTTALGVAAPLGNLEIVKMLVEAGADVENGNVPGQSPLVLAASENQDEVISYLLQRGAKPDSNKFQGLTALMVAASMGNSKTTRMLLDAGADVNARTSANGTALIFGSCKTDESRGSLEVVKMLVAAGADLFVTTEGGKNALKMARDDKLNDIADYLYTASKAQIDIDNLAINLYNAGSQVAGLSKNPSPTPWGDAQKLLDKGAKGNFANKSGETALILFSLDAKGFDETIAKRLIVVSDVNAQPKGATALHFAAQSGNERMVALLIAAGAKLSTVSNKGNTPLDSAHNFPAIVAMLRNAGAES
ncbi:MAG: ankyrin repeat domain-containing protein [Abditibacteriaceae bacterium]